MARCIGGLLPLVLLARSAAETHNQFTHQLGHLRALMQAAPDLPAEVQMTVVETAVQFAAAIEQGAEHIEVIGHLDLTSLRPSGETVLGIVPSSVKSIRGNCNGAIPALRLSGAATMAVRAQQCLMVVDRRMMDTSPESELLWVDGLYLRYQKGPEVQEYNAGLIDAAASAPGKLFLTSVTMQGDGDGEKDCGACALRAGGRLYAQDCIFANFEGDMMVHTGSAKSAVFDGCTFTDNSAQQAVLTAWSASVEDSGVVVVERSSFDSNFAPSMLQARDWEAGESAIFFSDEPLTLMNLEKNTEDATLSAASSLADFPTTRATLSTDDADFSALKQALPTISRTVVTPVAVPTTAALPATNTATPSSSPPVISTTAEAPEATASTAGGAATTAIFPEAGESGAADVTSPVNLTPSPATDATDESTSSSANSNGATTSTPLLSTSGADVAAADTDASDGSPATLTIPSESVNMASPDEVERGTPRGLVLVFGAVLLGIFLSVGVVALSVRVKRRYREKQIVQDWDEYMARKDQAFVLDVAVPHTNTYVPPENLTEDVEAATPPANAIPPRPASFYADSLGDAFVSPFKPASTRRFVPSSMRSPEIHEFGRADSGQDSGAPSSSSGEGHSGTGQKLLR